MDNFKETVKMLDRQYKKVTVRKCRLQIYLDLGWTKGWPEDADENKDEGVDENKGEGINEKSAENSDSNSKPISKQRVNESVKPVNPTEKSIEVKPKEPVDELKAAIENPEGTDPA